MEYVYEEWWIFVVLDHRCLRRTTRVFWDFAWVSNPVLGQDGKSIDEVINHQLRWLGLILRMSNLEGRCWLVSEQANRELGSFKPKHGTNPWIHWLSHINRSILSGEDLHDYHNHWLASLDDTADNRSKWCRCIHSFFLFPKSYTFCVFFNT